MKVVVSYAYDSWGKLLGIEGELKDTLGVKNPYRYKGYRYDNETGLYYLKSRYYNPELGRFISADAVVGKTGEILSHNLFSYCGNNPVNAIDEDGNMFEWIKSKWNAAKKAVATGVRKVVSGAKRVASRVVGGVKKAVRSASNWVRNKYRGYTNTGRNTYRRTKKWVNNTARTVSQRVRSTSHSVVKHTRNFVNNHRKEIEITRNIVAIASIAVLAIPAAPAMAIVALGVLEVGLDLAAGDNTSAAVGLLCLFPMGKGIKYVTEIGGDAIKGGSKAKNLYKAEGLLGMDLQKFGKLVNKTEREIPWILPNSLPREEEKAVLNTLKCIDSGTKPSSSLVKKWGTKFRNYQGELPNGKYREFRVSPPVGTKNAGVRRIVGNIETGELYYTCTHYGDTGKPAFVKIT